MLLQWTVRFIPDHTRVMLVKTNKKTWIYFVTCRSALLFVGSTFKFTRISHTLNATKRSLMYNVPLNSDNEEEEGGFGCSRTRVCVAPPIGGQSGGNSVDM